MKSYFSYLSDEALSSELQKHRADLRNFDNAILHGQGTHETIRLAHNCTVTIRQIEAEIDRRAKEVTA